MAWRTARSIMRLFDQLEHEAPAAAPGASGGIRPDEWGTVGDVAHDSTSDHSPKDFPGWGSQIVTAGDFPNQPRLGLDAHKVLDSIRLSHDARVKYGISNDQIFSSYATASRKAWTWGAYNPGDASRDRHLTHGHLSVVGDARADGTQDWQIGGSAAPNEGEDDMGASFGPITIEREGVTSLTIPPVQAGAADPRQAWLNFCNDTGADPYALRIWLSSGSGAFKGMPGTDANGYVKLTSGQRWSRELPAGTACITITRLAVDAAGKMVPANDELPAYAGHLTCAIERGPVIRA